MSRVWTKGLNASVDLPEMRASIEMSRSFGMRQSRESSRPAVSSPPTIFADFHNADVQGRIRLNTVGTLDDLSRQQVQLQDGLSVLLFTDDADEVSEERRLVVEGRVVYSTDEQCWVAVIDWQAIQSEAGASSPPAAEHPTSRLPGAIYANPPPATPSVPPANK
jgi:hypothetical protein